MSASGHPRNVNIPLELGLHLHSAQAEPRRLLLVVTFLIFTAAFETRCHLFSPLGWNRLYS
jgi:hypothetical protein